jgi:hypothetical protein
MAIQPIQQATGTPSATDAILLRLDAIMCELQALRQVVLVSQPQPSGSIVDQLWGALGQGTAEELADFENDIYLEMFDDESAN